MKLALDRIEIESVGPDPVRLATALLAQLPELDGPVPIEVIACSLDIEEIVAAPLRSLAGCLQCDNYKSYGQIVVNAQSPPRRRRYTIAHELGHFLNERHRPTSELGFDCTADDMSSPRRDGVRLRQEREANTFAIEVLTPRRLLTRHLRPAADLERALAIARRFDVSREAATRRYVALHDESLAAVFSENGSIRYIEKGPDFPNTLVWAGDPLPSCNANEGGARLTNINEVDPAAWLKWSERIELFAQTLSQENGFATTLLVAERHDDTYNGSWDPPRFRG